ncbi:hypothetical protein NQ315_016610 [Exocentrus adspersus]|uniref:Uncharacterized protein n=1 Tax=Exocentrus adspersus TaxID=1586481 RepID=A0AAV8VQ23_9CUCU|nr:hypothetical protein NQ315_016610 [Exocentrus adspersus]
MDVMCLNMFKIVIFLFLCTGTLSLQDDNNADYHSQLDAIPDNEAEKSFNPTDTNKESTVDVKSTQPKPKTAHPNLDMAQINMLAEKVIRLHGVNLDNMDDDSIKNIQKLKQVVAGVEKNLNEKLILTQTKTKAKESVPVLNENTQNENKKETISEYTDQSVDEGLETNIPKTQNLNENQEKSSNIDQKREETAVNEENAAKPTELDNETIEGNDYIENREDIQNVDEEADYVNNDDSTNEDKLDENEAESNTENTGATEDVLKPSESEKELESEEDKDADEDEREITGNESKTQADYTNNEDSDLAENVTENGGFIEETLKANVGEDFDALRENENESELGSNNDNKDTDEADITESGVETGTKNGELESINEETGACGLTEECDQTTERNARKYLEEHNSEEIIEDKLESTIEDTDFQKLIKYVTSFFIN